jgi:pimeloyl-ACP methyl ester carboxylesterase
MPFFDTADHTTLHYTDWGQGRPVLFVSGWALAMIQTDFRPELRDVTVPTLIIQGDHDASIPLELSGRRTVELIPDAQLKVYENAPHGLYLSHRDRLNEDLLEFIKR